MGSNSELPVARSCYPEIDFGGFTRYDGTIAFYTRVNALLRPDAVVLDLGCGRGAAAEGAGEFHRRLRNFRGRSRRVVGIDVDPVGSTNPTLDEFRLIEDVANWPLEDGSVDLIVCDYVLEHVEDPDRFFAEASRVVRPGGHFCARTPNATNYIAMMSRLIPNRFHSRVIGQVQSGRKDEDVFPTVYRCNGKRRLGRLLHDHGFFGCVMRHEAEPGYLSFSPFVYRVGALAHRCMPGPLKSTLFVFAGRRE